MRKKFSANIKRDIQLSYLMMYIYIGGDNMPSTKEYLNFILEQLSALDEITHKAMMGEYILYYRGRIFGGIYYARCGA